MSSETNGLVLSARDAFSYLETDFGFARPTVHRSPALLSVVFLGPIAVEVVWERRDRYVTVYLTRLRAGRIPVAPPIQRLGLEVLCRARAGRDEWESLNSANVDGSRDQLPAMARTVRDHAADALRGDPSLFNEVRDLRDENGIPLVEPWLWDDDFEWPQGLTD